MNTTSMYREPLSCLCTQESMESPAYKFLCENFLKEKPYFHRKQWEFAYILSMLDLHGKLRSNMKGLGFGCGKERLVPALAKLGINLTITDMDFNEAKSRGWVSTNQHSSNIDSFKTFCPEVCSLQDLENLSYRVVDMNHLPQDLTQANYDFVWSACSLEHVGSMDLAKTFIQNSIKCLNPGGIAVHTTEFNLSSDTDTLLTGPSVLFRRCDILNLVESLRKINGIMYNISFDPGDKELDKFIDVPPYLGNDELRHLKLQVGQYTCTSIGICIRKEE